MITYGESLGFCVSHAAVFRFVLRRERGEFLAANMDIPGEHALEMAVDILGKTQVAHYPLDSSKEPSAAIAVAMIACVEFFLERQSSLAVGGVN